MPFQTPSAQVNRALLMNASGLPNSALQFSIYWDCAFYTTKVELWCKTDVILSIIVRIQKKPNNDTGQFLNGSIGILNMFNHQKKIDILGDILEKQY